MELQLINFDNLAKTLTFCIYIMCYTDTEKCKGEFIEYINKTYSVLKIRNILEEIAKIINANILYITEYDYDPYGASVNVLISDSQINNLNNKDICAHLDKSHISVHTYPEIGKESNVSYVRIDLEISTCGNISPLNSLSMIVDYFNPDVLIYDFVIRGVTRNGEGKRIYTCRDYRKCIRKFNNTQLNRYHVIKKHRYRNNGVEKSMLKRRKKFSDCINRNEMINCEIWVIVRMEALRFCISLKLSDDTVSIFGIVFCNESFNTRGIKDSHVGFSRVNSLTDWFSKVSGVLKYLLQINEEVLFETGDFRCIRNFIKTTEVTQRF